MTLILAMPTKGPLVFAADKRLTVAKNKYEDTFNKIITIGETAIGSAYGPVRLLGEGSNEIRFDVFEILRAFFANGIYTPQRLAEAEVLIKSEFAKYRKSYRNGEVFKQTFRVIIYACDNGEFRLNHRKFWTNEDGAMEVSGTNCRCKHGGIYADGDDAILTELISGHKPTFDDLRNDKDIQRFLVNRQKQAIEEVVPEEAINFCQRLIGLCNEYYPMLGGEKNPISKECNVAMLNRNGGSEVLI